MVAVPDRTDPAGRSTVSMRSTVVMPWIRETAAATSCARTGCGLLAVAGTGYSRLTAVARNGSPAVSPTALFATATEVTVAVAFGARGPTRSREMIEGLSSSGSGTATPFNVVVPGT